MPKRTSTPFQRDNRYLNGFPLDSSDNGRDVEGAEEGAIDSPPPAPSSITDVGLSASFLAELLLKFIFHQGALSASELATRAALPRGVVEEVLDVLKKEHLCEVAPGSSQVFAFRLTEAGKQRAEDALALTRYVGPVPVPLEQYVPMIARLRWRRWRVGQAQIRRALSHLVLSDQILESVGLAFHSGRAAVIYGPSGNGKTEIVTALSGSVSEHVVLPYALFLHGQVIRIFDPLVHEVISTGGEVVQSTGKPVPDLMRPAQERVDSRWLSIKRPVVVVGGEFSLEDLELSYDAADRVYVAPASVQAQGGTLVIDDLGRQRVRPADILNRWIVPLERGYDTLVLQTGGFAVVPFRVSLVLATNLPLEEILDEAHLRRIPYKIRVDDPSRAEFNEILRRMCDEKGVPYSDTGAQHLLRRLDAQCPQIRACFPRDIIQIMVEASHYRGRDPELAPDLIDAACDLYLNRPLRRESYPLDHPAFEGHGYPQMPRGAASG